MEYGIQLYSVRDLAEKDYDAAVEGVAKLGYSFVETAGFFGRTAQQFNDLMAKNGLRLNSTHTKIPELWENYEETVAFHKAVGNKYYIIPGHPLNSQAQIDDFVEKVNFLQPKLAAEGITMAFHNHARELIANPDGTVAMEHILARTSLKLEVDTYWAFVGLKTNPIPFLERVKDRLVALHIKDGSSDGHGTPLGRGEAPVAEVVAWAKAHNLPMVVESETCTPDGLTEAEICIKYLKSLEPKE